MNSELRNLIISEKDNPELHSTIDIKTLLLAAENVDMNDLGNRSLTEISQEIVQALQNLGLHTDKIREICGKLAEYRLTDQVFQIQKGRHVRWIRGTEGSPMTPPSANTINSRLNTNKGRGLRGTVGSLTNGGIVVDVKFLDNGTHILCKNGPRFIQYKFDDCLTFQKLSVDEQMVLSCYDLLRK